MILVGIGRGNICKNNDHLFFFRCIKASWVPREILEYPAWWPHVMCPNEIKIFKVEIEIIL